MSAEEIEILRKEIREIRDMVIEYHEEAKGIASSMRDEMRKIAEDVRPVVELTRNASGAGKLLNWVFAQWKWFALLAGVGYFYIKQILSKQ